LGDFRDIPSKVKTKYALYIPSITKKKIQGLESFFGFGSNQEYCSGLSTK
jgi:hypothetical protein